MDKAELAEQTKKRLELIERHGELFFTYNDPCEELQMALLKTDYFKEYPKILVDEILLYLNLSPKFLLALTQYASDFQKTKIMNHPAYKSPAQLILNHFEDKDDK